MHLERDVITMPKIFDVAAVALLAAYVSGSSCTADAFCAKRTECLSSEENIDLEDDSTRVCATEQKADFASLYANDEIDCHILADALIALQNCQAGLDCDDFSEADLGGKCDDQRDDLSDASDDVSGFECTPQD